MAEGGPPPIGKTIGILTADGTIMGAMKLPPPGVGNGAALPTPNFAVAGEQDSLLDAMHAMEEAGAAILLVSTNAPGRKAEDVVGVLTLARVAQHLEQVEGAA